MKQNAIKLRASRSFTQSPLALALSAAVLGLGINSNLYAAGFQVSEQSASGLGRANAGNGAIAEDASVIATNPALMTGFDKKIFTLVGTHVDPDVEVSGTKNAGTVSLKEDEAVGDALVPAIYYIQPINDKLSIGIGAFSNFGLKSEYGSDFGGTEFADTAAITTININPSVAYKLNDSVSLGFGLNYLMAEAELKTSLPSDLGGGDIIDLAGDGTDIGWNAGISWQASTATVVGLSYRSAMSVDISGDISSDVQAALNNDGELELNLPDITDLSIAHQVNEQWQLSGSVTYTNWENFDELSADVDGVGNVHIKDENWHGSYRYALGSSYQINPTVLLRAGLAYDESPVDAEYRSLSIPDSSRIWYSTGANIVVNKMVNIDLAYVRVDGEKVDVTESSSIGTTFDGTSEGDANIFSAQLNVAF